MSAFNAAWFVLKNEPTMRGEGIAAGSSVPVEERRRMARAGQIDRSKGVFPRSRDKRERKPKTPKSTDPMTGDETNPMESPVMRTTEQIGEMEREAEEDMFKASPFDAAWSMLKKDEKFKPEPSRQMQLDGSQPKGHPSTTYGMKTPAMTRKPTGSLRTGAVPAQASQEDIEEFMRINSPRDDDERDIEAQRRITGAAKPYRYNATPVKQDIPPAAPPAPPVERPRHLRNVDFDKELQIGLKELAEFNRLAGDGSMYFVD